MSKTRFLTLFAVLAALATGMLAIGCGDDDESTTSDDAAGGDLELIQEGTLTVGTDTPYPPFEIGQPPNISGFDIDLLNAIAEEMGVTAEYTDTSFDTIFGDVQSGKFDVAAAASTITPGRERAVDFSDPYYETQQALVVLPDSDIASVEDLSGAIVGAQDGTTGETYGNDETDASEVRGYPEGPDALAALKTGQIEAVIIDQPVAEDAIEKQGGFEIAEEIPTGEFYGFAVGPDSPNLLAAINDALATVVENGTYEEIYGEYFDAAPPESIGQETNDLSSD